MNCPKCGATVLRDDQVCKKCGAILNEASEVYDPSKYPRSRWNLLFKAWFGAWAGLHLAWLGYEDEAKEVISKFGEGMGEFFGLIFSGHVFSACFYLMALSFYHGAEVIGIMFGEYRTDAQGHPIRYFAKTKE